ncbi:MAG: hypothetical protein H7A48_11630 [Akkermansiaceae bacterium]|nr:hypothetical protein [Akkermansiaceae bacterium]
MSTSTQSKWNKNNAAHAFTYLNLILFKELPKSVSFTAAESYKTSNLAFFTKSSSQKMRELRARLLAVRLDTAFRFLQGAVFEKGKNQNSAEKALTAALLDPKGTVGLLGRVADENYLFHTEIK